MKTVLLAGGLGTRMREETEYRPKPMVEIGGRPILWHLMKLFANAGHSEFVVATGYKSEIITDYFLNYEGRNNDFTVRLGDEHQVEFHGAHDEGDWEVTVAYTGEATQTGDACRESANTSTMSASCAPTGTVLQMSISTHYWTSTSRTGSWRPSPRFSP